MDQSIHGARMHSLRELDQAGLAGIFDHSQDPRLLRQVHVRKSATVSNDAGAVVNQVCRFDRLRTGRRSRGVGQVDGLAGCAIPIFWATDVRKVVDQVGHIVTESPDKDLMLNAAVLLHIVQESRHDHGLVVIETHDESCDGHRMFDVGASNVLSQLACMRRIGETMCVAHPLGWKDEHGIAPNDVGASEGDRTPGFPLDRRALCR